MHPDGRNNFVAFGVYDTYIIRTCIDDVNLILLIVRCDPSRLTSGLERSHRLKRPQIDHADRVALSIRDVSVLAVGRTIVGQFALMEVPPAERRSDRHCENCEEDRKSTRLNSSHQIISY